MTNESFNGFRGGSRATVVPNAFFTLLLPEIEAVRTSDHAVEVDLPGSEEECASLLAGLLKAGFRVIEFRHRRADLEQIFMTVTKGEVQ